MDVSTFIRSYLVALEKAAVSKSQAAALAGMKQPVLSRLLNLERPVYADHLSAMLRALPLEERERCLVNWLIDQCPEEFRGRIKVQFDGEAVEAGKVEPIYDELGRALILLETEATAGRNTALRRTLIHLARLVQGQVGRLEEERRNYSQKENSGGDTGADFRTA